MEHRIEKLMIHF